MDLSRRSDALGATRCAVIGTGHIGRFHAQKYAELAEAALVAVADRNPEAAARVAAECGCRAETDYRKLLGSVDAVSIAVPTTRHFEVAREFLEAGVHALIEKPITSTVDEARILSSIAAYLGVAHAVSCASGTDALHLALRAADIGRGDEVITTPFTFIATAEAICYVGATPVFVDIAQVEAAISERTAAVLPVHLYGQPADMKALRALCDAHRLWLIEDCAQSFGARAEGGAYTGSIGEFGCFSFFPSKNLGCYGDGGLVTTSTESMANRLRKLRNHGSSAQYEHDLVGYNSRLDEIQAAVLRIKLRHIDRFNAGRRAAAQRYDALLEALPLRAPYRDPRVTHVFHQYTVLCKARDLVVKALRDAGIACAIYYPRPLHRQKAFSGMVAGASLPVTEDVARDCLSLPMYPELTEVQARRVAEVLAAAL